MTLLESGCPEELEGLSQGLAYCPSLREHQECPSHLLSRRLVRGLITSLENIWEINASVPSVFLGISIDLIKFVCISSISQTTSRGELILCCTLASLEFLTEM